MPSRSPATLPSPSPAARAASSAAASAIAVARSSGMREGDCTACASKSAAATGTSGTSSPMRSTVRARTAERPAKTASANAAVPMPIGLTTPLPVTATGAAPRLADDIAARLRRDRVVDQRRELRERDAGLAGIEALLGDADVEAVLDREDELHQRERVEAELIERRCRRHRGGVDVEALDQDGRDGGERRRLHARAESGEGASYVPTRGGAGRPGRIRPRSPACLVAQTSLELGFADNAAPLAERLRPKTIDEVIGQRHLLGPGKPLRVAFESGRLHSMILWGPPGVGKTTLARLMADAFAAQFIAMSAVLGGVKDIREAVERAQAARTTGRATVVFVDEVHRFNKSQQDAFLPHVESGLFTFIGATTENPSFEFISALLSRATVHVLKPLDDGDLETLLDRAQALLAAPPLVDGARERLIGYADGDARRLLNAYENLVATVRT